MQPTSETANSTRRRIVVGVDGSKSSVDALHWAERLATALGAQIDAVTAWNYPSSYGMSAWPVDWNPAADADAALQHALRLAFGDSTPAGLIAVVSEGHPANILVEASSGAELLVVGSRGHGGFVGLLIGATSAHCAEHAACSVFIAHDGPPDAPVR
jgi:nucleotide-binding universal stress UspA family protein